MFNLFNLFTLSDCDTGQAEVVSKSNTKIRQTCEPHFDRARYISFLRMSYGRGPCRGTAPQRGTGRPQNWRRWPGRIIVYIYQFICLLLSAVCLPGRRLLRLRLRQRRRRTASRGSTAWLECLELIGKQETVLDLLCNEIMCLCVLMRT